MNKLFLTFCIALLPGMGLFAQNTTREFEISLPETIIQNSLYHAIEFLDSRTDTSQLGIVQLGAFNNQAKVISKIPFSTQLGNVMRSLTDSTAKNGELLFQLRQFNFAEISGAVSEKGYCYLRAELYSKNDNDYRKIASIDTCVLIKAMDVTKALFKSGSQLLTNLIADNLLKDAHESDAYSLRNIVKIDSLEKRKIRVYNIDTYTDGLYYSYESFKNQVPDKQITVETKKDGSISNVKISDDNNLMVKVKSKDVYSVIYKGQPFIASDYGYYPLKKENDEFYFTGKAKVAGNSSDVMAAGFFFGVAGALLAVNVKATFEIKLDHINGGFIHCREIDPYAEKEINKP